MVDIGVEIQDTWCEHNNSGLVKHLYICVDLIYVKMYKKDRLWEFREIYIVGTQRVSQEADSA